MHMCKNEIIKLGFEGLSLDKNLKQKIWDRNFSVLDFKENKNNSFENRNTIYCYTDGSKVKDLHVGCGFTLKKASQSIDNHQEYLGTKATVFQAEVLAIHRACSALIKRKNQKIVIRSDSQAAIQALKATDVDSSLVLECVKGLNKLGSKNKVTLQWIKAHCGHEGNEEADQLAKAGAEMIALGPEPFLPVPDSYIQIITKTYLEKCWNSRWHNLKSCRQTKHWFAKSTNKIDKILGKSNRFELGRIVQFITGHCNLNRHKSLQNKSLGSTCRKCEKDEETPWHLVTSCPSFLKNRENIFHARILYSIDWSPEQLLRFCKESSIWSMLDQQ